tara:strand:+ start:1185 stop:1298 length:114 start_codon:yes stop_codon:yes gene_type:complete
LQEREEREEKERQGNLTIPDEPDDFKDEELLAVAGNL